MNPKTPRAVLALLFTLSSVLLVSYAEGRSLAPPVNHTGAPGHSSCLGCHNPTGATGDVTLDFSDLAGYEPGTSYQIQVTISDPGKLRFGFAMAARDADNTSTNVGTLSAGSADTATQGVGQIAHRNAPFVADSHTFTVNWQAPARGVGDVTFYVAGVAANGNRSNGGGDNVYVRNFTIAEQVAQVNMPPSIAVAAEAVAATVGVATPIAGVSVDDPDAADGLVTMILSVQDGTIAVSDSIVGGVQAGGISDNGTAAVTVEGTLAELNLTFGAPNGIVYTSDEGFVGSDTLQLEANDNGNTGDGGALTGSANLAIEVAGPPALTFQGLVVGEFLLTLRGTVGRDYVVEHSSDLQNWTMLEQVTLVVAAHAVVDDGVSGVLARYYRAREVVQE